MKKEVVFISIIFILGAFLRFYRLGEIPQGFHRDEAFLGYNAYSLLKTGKDINAHFLPLHLESFLYSPAGYSYISIPFIALFGLSEFSVRFASAFFGSLTVILTFFLVQELFNKSSHKRTIGLLSSFLIAISPWHINLSRTATENVIVVFLITLATILYLLWLRKEKSYLLFFSFLSFGFTFIIYQAPRAFLPIFIPLLFLLFFNSKIKFKKTLYVVVLFILFILLPLFIILSSKELSLRIRTVSIFASQETQLTLDQEIREDGVSSVPNVISRVFHNKIIGYSNQLLENYFAHFSYSFLFTDRGFPDRYRVPLSGLVYLFELPFLALGVWKLIKYEKKVGFFLIGWVLFTPLGSALTFDDVPNLQRTLIMFPVLSIISAYGMFSFFKIIQTKKTLSIIFLLFLVSIAIYQVAFYLHQYYVHARLYRPWYRHDGYRELVTKVNNILPLYKKAVITDRESAPTIFFLFYEKYDPSIFQKETKNSSFRDFDRIAFGKYEFTQEECPLRNIIKGSESFLTGEKGILYVNSGLCKIPNNVNVLSTVDRADGSLVFVLLARKNEKD